MHHPEYFESILAFVHAIGIAVELQAIPGPSFLPGIAIRSGALVVDPDALQWPGDILHEAGHLAVLPPERRAGASDDLSDTSIPGGGELEALAWSFAAAHRLGLPPSVLFHPGGYKGQSEGLILSYTFGVCPGLKGLCEAGMATAPGFGSTATAPPYPHMIRWLRT